MTCRNPLYYQRCRESMPMSFYSLKVSRHDL